MKAMRLPRIAPVEQAPLEPVEVPDPRPGANDVLLDVEACGVCRTDLHIAEVAGIRPGDLVGVGWLSETCGQCVFCRSGRENLCRFARFTGRDRDGGYAERMTAPESAVYRLPPDLD